MKKSIGTSYLLEPVADLPIMHQKLSLSVFGGSRNGRVFRQLLLWAETVSFHYMLTLLVHSLSLG